jgi:hypothetical protein
LYYRIVLKWEGKGEGRSYPWVTIECRTRADIVRQAIEYYLDDYEDVARAIEVLRDPADVVLDWEVVKRELLLQD